jgi:hypothetical protein
MPLDIWSKKLGKKKLGIQIIQLSQHLTNNN